MKMEKCLLILLLIILSQESAFAVSITITNKDCEGGYDPNRTKNLQGKVELHTYSEGAPIDCPRIETLVLNKGANTTMDIGKDANCVYYIEKTGCTGAPRLTDLAQTKSVICTYRSDPYRCDCFCESVSGGHQAPPR